MTPTQLRQDSMYIVYNSYIRTLITSVFPFIALVIFNFIIWRAVKKRRSDFGELFFAVQSNNFKAFKMKILGLIYNIKMEWFFDHILCHATPPPFLDRFPRFWYQRTALDNDQVVPGPFFRISTSGQISSGSFIAGNKYFEGCIFSKIFLEEDYLGNRDGEMKKKQYFNKKVNFLKMRILHGSRPGKMVVFADMM